MALPAHAPMAAKTIAAAVADFFILVPSVVKQRCEV
jgi:hypothetical protein